MSKGKKRLRIVIIAIVSAIIILLGGFYIYTLDYYRADEAATQLLTADYVTELKDGLTLIAPQSTLNEPIGLIFYPGGKVEASAYLPLLDQLSQRGYTCILVKMPFNLAVFGINAADKVFDRFPEIQTWYFAGHSLGGAMASSYAGSHTQRIEGLILLGAYPINDATIPTLAIYGSEDVKLDTTKLRSGDMNIELVGGNHAQFGNYGKQDGDGTATITRESQQAQAVEAIVSFIQETQALKGTTVEP